MQVTFVFHYFHEHKEIVEAKHVNATEAELVDSLKLLRVYLYFHLNYYFN